MNKGIIAGVLLLGGAGGLIYGLSGNEKDGGESLDGGPVLEEVMELPAPKEADAVQVIYGNRNNKPMRLVGQQTRTPAVVDSEVGRVTETPTVDPEAMCPVLFEAPVKKDSNPPVPNMPAFGDFDGREMRPVQLPESNQGQNWVWFTYLRGQDCVNMAGHGQFLGSDLQSVLKLPAPMQRRILRAEVQCVAEQPNTCVVPIDDARVTDETFVFIPVSLAGRADLNFVSKRGGKIESRVQEPDGGWAAD